MSEQNNDLQQLMERELDQEEIVKIVKLLQAVVDISGDDTVLEKVLEGYKNAVHNLQLLVAELEVTR